MNTPTLAYMCQACLQEPSSNIKYESDNFTLQHAQISLAMGTIK